MRAGLAPALALVALFSLSQSCARIVARNAPSPVWGPPRLAFLNGSLLLTFWAIAGPGSIQLDGSALTRRAVLLSVGIFAVQVLYLFALAKTTPFLSATLLSAGVPISIVGDSLLKVGPSHTRLALWLSVCFSVATGLVTWLTSDGISPLLGSRSAAEAS